jgi:hypothetical protein
VLPKAKKPSFQMVISASGAKTDLTALAKSSPSAEEPMNNEGFAIVVL